MLILDSDNRVIDNPDMDAGTVEPEDVGLLYEWVVDAAEETHEEVMAEYPNGGRDVAIVVDAEERGHWSAMALLPGGEAEVEWADPVPDDWPHEPCSNIMTIGRYRLYTADELAEAAARRAEAERAEKEAAERAAYLAKAPARTDALETDVLDHDEAITGLYESMTQAQLDTDEALVAIYETMNGGV